MKKRIVSIIIGFALAILAPQITTAQGTTTFLSNLGETSTGSNPVGSDSWLAASFFAGNNSGGYILNSVQLGMGGSLGNPSGFTVMICALAPDPTDVGGSLGTLTGSANPSTAGTYTYNAPSSLSISPDTQYFIVITAGTTVANGSYEWSYMNTDSYQPVDDWEASLTLASPNGSSWGPVAGYPTIDFSQFALLATPVPEPGVIGLFSFGALLVGFLRRKARAVN